jgi:recombination protein RecA
MFKGDLIGIDMIGDLVDTAEMMGYVERTGAWYILPDGNKIQGRDAFVTHVRDNPELQESIREKLNGS